MTDSPLYISYGMPKSGSTLAFELTRTMLELSAIPQKIIEDEVVDSRSSKVNFVRRLDGPALDALRGKISMLAKPLAIKTHSKLFPRMRQELMEGRMIGHAVCRDPRDMALSLLDAAREGRAWGSGPDGPFRSVNDTIKRLHTNIATFRAWAAAPNILAIHYERLAFDTEAVAGEIAAQIGIDVNLPEVVRIATKERFIQLNHGKSQRWKSQMDPGDALRLEKEFKDYIDTFCSEIPENKEPAKPRTKFFTGWFRPKG